MKKTTTNLAATAALFAAIASRKRAAVDAALAAGANPNGVGDGRLPLENALFAGKFDIAQLLVDRGASVDCVTSHGTLLVGLCDCDGEKMAKPEIKVALWLIERGASCTRAREDGSTPLMHAARSRGTYDLIEVLLANGAKPTADNAGNTPLHWAVGNDARIWERLLAAGNKLEAKNRLGETPLTHAQKEWDVAMVTFLLGKGAKRGTKVDGQTALERAIAAKQTKIVKLLA